jgi:hypothetical protein
MFSIDWRVCCFFFVPPRSILQPAQSRVRAAPSSGRIGSPVFAKIPAVVGEHRSLRCPPTAAAEKWSAMRTLGLAALVLVVLTLAACSPGAAGGAAGPARPVPDSRDKPGGGDGGGSSM